MDLSPVDVMRQLLMMLLQIHCLLLRPPTRCRKYAPELQVQPWYCRAHSQEQLLTGHVLLLSGFRQVNQQMVQKTSPELYLQIQRLIQSQLFTP